jgi:hypothetical protein
MQKITSLIAILAASNLILAGCLAPESESDAAAANESSSAPAETTGAVEANASVPENSAPILVVEISENGTAVELVDGIANASAGVELTFDAGNSSDADGDNLTFSWDLGDGTTADTPNVTHAYAEAGNFTVNVTVSDGEGGEANASYTLVVASSGPAPGTPIRKDTQTFTGTVTAAVQTTTCGQGAGLPSHKWTIPGVEPDGTLVIATQLVVVLTPGTTHFDPAFDVIDPAGKLLAHVDNAFLGAESVTLKGEFAPGDYTIKNQTCTAVQGSYTIKAEADLVAA